MLLNSPHSKKLYPTFTLDHSMTARGGPKCISASRIAGVEYCSMQEYCEQWCDEPTGRDVRETQSRMDRGTEKHERVGRDIQKHETRKGVSTWLIPFLLLVLGVLILLYLLF